MKIYPCLVNKSGLDQEESQTIIHCNYVSSSKYKNGGWINIHPLTFLINGNGKGKLKLLHIINIPMAPIKHYFTNVGDSKRFTLVFQGIPSYWENFSLVEQTKNENRLFVNSIKKNKTGIYEISINR